MGNVGTADIGKVLIGQGSGNSPIFAGVGTGSGLTTNGVLIAKGNNAFTTTTTGTLGQVLQSGGPGSPPSYSTATFPSTAAGAGTILISNGTNWVASTSTYPTTNAANTLLYASSSNVMAALSTANNGLLVTSNSGVPSILAGSGTTGQVLQSNAAAAPSFSTATYPSTTAQGDLLISSAANTVTSLAKNASSTRYLSNTGTSNNPAWAQVALTTGVTGVLPIANGGSNASSFTQSNGVVTYNGTSLVNYAGPQINSSGQYTNTTQPAFFAYSSVQQTAVTGEGTQYQILLNSTLYNVGSGYSTGTSLFTAPVAGNYLFTWACEVSGIIAANTAGYFIITMAGTSYYFWRSNFFTMSDPGTGTLFLTGSIVVNLAATNVVTFYIVVGGNGAKNIGVLSNGSTDPRTWLSGVLIC